MRDLVLHSNLRAGRRDPDDLATLEALAKLPPARRVGFVTELRALLDDPDPTWRRAGLRALVGMRGQAIEEATIAALDDPEPSVRLEAVAALRASPHTLRIAHALFHARADVRRAALDSPPPDAQPLCFALRADPEVRDAVAAGMRPPTPMLPFVHVFVREGWLPVDEARPRLLAPIVANEALRYPPLREPEALWAWLFDVFAGASEPERVLLVRRLEEQARQRPDAVLASLRAERARRPDARLTRALAGLDASYFLDEAEPLAERHACLREVDLRAVLVPRERHAKKALAERLLAHPLVRHVDGTRAGALELAAALTVLSLHAESPYASLVDAFGFDEVAAAVLADPAAAAQLYERPASGPRDRAWFLDELARLRPEAAYDGRAVTLIAASAADPRLREALEAESTREGYASVVARVLVFARAMPLKPKRATRLAERLAEHVDEAELDALLRAALAVPALGGLDDRFVGALGRRLGDTIVDRIDAAPDGAALAERLGEATTFPFAVERALALRWKDHPDEARRAFAAPRLPKPPPPAPKGRATLDDATREALATAPDLGAALARLEAPVTGLTGALAARLPEPNVRACAWLLICGDPEDDVLSQLRRFEGEAPATFEELVLTELSRFAGRKDLSPLAHAALARWEPHAFAAFDALAPSAEGLLASLQAFRRARSALARRIVWRALGRAVALWRWRDRVRLATYASDALLDLLVDTFDSELGSLAARLFVALFEAGVADEGFRRRHAAIVARLPKLDAATRAALATYAKLEGLPTKAASERTFADLGERLGAIQGSTDLAFLEATVGDRVRELADEAVLRLFGLGAEGEAVLLRCLAAGGVRGVRVARMASYFLHVDRPRLEALLSSVDPATRFHLALQLDDDEAALEAALAPLPDGASWMEPDDAALLRRRIGDARFATALVTSPHPDVYVAAVKLCIDRGVALHDDEVRAALRAFLALGTERSAELRLAAARALDRLDDDFGAPLLVEDVLVRKEPRPWFRLPLDALVDGALAVGSRDFELTAAKLGLADDPEAARAHRLLRARDAAVRASASAALVDPRRASRHDKVRALGETFAWGVRRGRELTGRLFRVHLVSDRRALGHTQLGSAAIHVAGWPLFDGAPRGRDVVEGLILHELGHQLFHADSKSRELWAKAGREGLQHLYNLVLDEHLERRLRARDAADGDRLKRLAAYAFRHAGRDLYVPTLLSALGPRAATVLIGRVRPSFFPGHVHVTSGVVLRAASEAGSAFARFVSALRMGTGVRDDDAVVREALALFDRGFKELDTAALYGLTERLAELFGHEAALLHAVGTPEELPADDPNARERREGISDDEVQREVERILAPPSRAGASTGRPSLQINVGPDEGFDPIRDVVRLPPDPELQRALAREVARPARRLRADLEALGLARVPVGARLAGTRLDRPRLRGLVLRGDPHVMQARVLEPRADLFLGVAVDCSGSMVGQSMELARRFAVLLAESARGLRGVDLRVFGFTHTQLFDAGDAERSTAASLQASGGNNDAAALAHVAEVARRSGRRAKLLVMISDGLPTECSVAALRGLVRRLTREGMACAQIAVRPLEERCFEHYVEVRDLSTDESVRRFGTIIARLVRQTLGAS